VNEIIHGEKMANVGFGEEEHLLVQGSGFRVQGSRFKVQGSQFRVHSSSF
jgi:hypothetical protein